MMDKIFQYYKNDTIDLSKRINIKKRIYLDTNYWLDICDVSLNKKENKVISEIYSILKYYVDTNKIICPISFPIILEVLSQNDDITLNKTVEVIDNLSQGYILKNNNLLELELYNFFYEFLNIETDEDKSKNYWDYVGNIFGFNIFKSDCFLMQKDYFEYFKTKKLKNLIKYDEFINNFNFSNKQIDLNYFQENKHEHIHKYNTFHILHCEEFAGLLEEHKEIVKSVIKNISENKAINEGIEINENYDYSYFINLVYNVFKSKKICNHLPTMNIQSMLHAKIRWNKTQKYKKGDLMDIFHASCALPYYDYMFTERSLSSVIRESGYDKKYSCNLYEDNEDILQLLKKLF